MPYLPDSPYRPPVLLRSAHLQTVYPALYRRVEGVAYDRERLELPDGDFLDLDWSRAGAGRVAVLCHGLESGSRAAYVRAMARALNRRAWDVVVLNFRGCSGVPNRLLRSYHSGDTGDLATVVAHVTGTTRPRAVALVGFSLGGNVVLKYLGESAAAVSAKVRAAVAVSVPCDLAGSARRMAAWSNRIYMKRFLRLLRAKIAHKARQFPDRIREADFEGIATFEEFDDRYTAPAHGFADAVDYWRRSSCRPFLTGIRIPALLLNAADDPFLSASCFPVDEARTSRWLELETPRWGGHVGFVRPGQDEYYHEARAGEFLREVGA